MKCRQGTLVIRFINSVSPVSKWRYGDLYLFFFHTRFTLILWWMIRHQNVMHSSYIYIPENAHVPLDDHNYFCITYADAIYLRRVDITNYSEHFLRLRFIICHVLPERGAATHFLKIIGVINIIHKVCLDMRFWKPVFNFRYTMRSAGSVWILL